MEKRILLLEDILDIIPQSKHNEVSCVYFNYGMMYDMLSDQFKCDLRGLSIYEDRRYFQYEKTLKYALNGVLDKDYYKYME